MKQASINIEKDFEIAKTDRRLFSSFLEHLGRAIYTGIYEPGHPTADENGFRQDVIDLVNELGVDYIRYPGGNFVSNYDWKDGIGPKADRPRRLELAWKSLESNQFGIDEFADWCKKAGTKIMGAVNMGTGTPKDAGEMLEYCNFPKGTYWSDLRRKNGHEEPHNIDMWCIGNEMDGDWQVGHLNASDYGKKAHQTAKIMKWIDPSVKLVACGSACADMPTYPEWDRVVLENTYDDVDFLSIHRYYENPGNTLDFLASFVDMDHFIKAVCATADYVKCLKRSKKTMYLSFDEWNIWYQSKDKEHDWMEAPHILEDHYSLLDALVLAGLGMTLVNHSDRVKCACLAQLVNVIAPIMTEKGGKAIRQTTFYPYKYLSKYSKGTVIRPAVKAPMTETKHGETPLLHTSVVYDDENDTVTVFLLNIDTEDITTSIKLDSFGKASMVEHLVLNGNDLNATNTFENPDNVVPHDVPVENGEFSKCDVKVPKESFNMLRFKIIK